MQLSIENILNEVSQVDIFSRVLGIPVEDIEYCANHNALMTSVFDPEEKSGSMGFKYRNDGKLICRDFGGDFWGDCFDAVADKHWLDVNRGAEFMKVLEIIAKEFSIGSYSVRHKRSFVVIKESEVIKRKSQTKKLDIYPRKWVSDDFRYWKSQGVTEEKLEEHEILPVLDAYIDGIKIFTHRVSYPGYAWYCGNTDEETPQEIWKLYAPTNKFFRTNGAATAISNRIHNANIGLICKSKKDLMAIEGIVEEVVGTPFFLQGYDMPSESVHPTKEQIAYLNLYWKDLYSFTDFDRQGVIAGNRMKKEYNIKPLFMPNGRFNSINYGAKDFAAYHEKFGHAAAVKLITTFLTKMQLI